MQIQGEIGMNGIDLINNLIDELARARDILLDVREGTEVTQDVMDELIDDIRADLDRYYDVADSIDACVEDIVVTEEEFLKTKKSR